jgi:uncharacterized protein (TIGR01777 family)
MTIVLYLLLVQVLLGGLDNFLHHEFTERLRTRPEARTELALHAAREALYAVIFVGIAWFEWHGGYALLLALLLLVEIGITIADFLVEDRTRRLPPFERALHTVLAVMIGIILAVLAPVLWAWGQAPSALADVHYGWLSWVFTAAGFGVAIFAIRDAGAALHLGKPDWLRHPIRASETPSGRTMLVTGATGFVGNELVRALIERGDRVIALSRHRARIDHKLGRHVRAIQKLDEIRDNERIDAIVHLAGEPVARPWWTAARKRQIVESRTHMTAALLKLAARLQTRPSVLVSASAVGIYGPTGDVALNERDRTGSGFMAESCRAVEAAAVRGQRQGLRVCRMRIGLVLGRGGGILPPLALASRFGLGAVLGNGRQFYSWIHIDDLVRLLQCAIDDPRIAGAVNATAPEPVTQRDFADALAKQVRRPRFLATPAWALRAGLGAMADLLLTGQRVHPATALRHEFAFNFPTLEAALPDLLATTMPDAAPDGCAVHFNDDCPVCSREIAHYRRIAERQAAPVGFHPIGEAPEALARYGLGRADIERRLCATDGKGRLLVGADAFIAIYASLPGYRRLASFLRRPVPRAIAEFWYEAIAVPMLARFNRVRRRRALAIAPMQGGPQ